jgi:hypothetical protein
VEWKLEEVERATEGHRTELETRSFNSVLSRCYSVIAKINEVINQDVVALPAF